MNLWIKKPYYLLAYIEKYADNNIDDNNILDDFNDIDTKNISIEEKDLINIHKLWYKVNEAPKYGISKEITSQWEENLMSLSYNTLYKLQQIVLDWLSLHYYKNPKLMWNKRLDEATELALFIVEDDNDEYEKISFWDVGRALKIDFDYDEFMRYIDNEFADWFFLYFYGNDFAEIFKEIYNLDLNSEDDLDPPQEYYDSEFNKLKNNKNYKKKLLNRIAYNPRDFLIRTPVPLSNDNTISEEVVRSAFIKYAISKHDYFIDNVNNNKGTNGIDTNFNKVSDIVEAQAIRNKKALNSSNVNEIVSAISLTLNIEHNFGNLILDHSENNISYEFLTELSNMNMKEEDEELSSIGLDIDSVYNEIEKPQYTRELNLQHDYYKEKEKERIKRILDKNKDKNVKELESLIAPYRGASNNWKNNFISIYNKK